MIKPIYALGLFLTGITVYFMPVASQANPVALEPVCFAPANLPAIGQPLVETTLQLLEAETPGLAPAPVTIKEEPVQPRHHLDGNFILGGAEAFPM